MYDAKYPEFADIVLKCCVTIAMTKLLLKQLIFSKCWRSHKIENLCQKQSFGLQT